MVTWAMYQGRAEFNFNTNGDKWLSTPTISKTLVDLQPQKLHKQTQFFQDFFITEKRQDDIDKDQENGQIET